jgi:hypothetical protein
MRSRRLSPTAYSVKEHEMTKFDEVRDNIKKDNDVRNKVVFKLDGSPKFGDPFSMSDLGLTDDETILMELADEMASAMSDLNPQNYKVFVDARDKVRKKIGEMTQKQKDTTDRIEKIKAAVIAA